MGSPEFHAKEALTKVVVGDLFSHSHPVIPVTTKDRSYGSISRRVVEMGITRPDISLGHVVYQEAYLFLGMWNDINECTKDFLFDCGAAVIAKA